jgi:hypothetical protein
MKRWVQMIDNRQEDLTVFHQNKLPGKIVDVCF